MADLVEKVNDREAKKFLGIGWKIAVAVAVAGIVADNAIRTLGYKEEFDYFMQTEVMPYVTELVDSVDFSIAEITLGALLLYPGYKIMKGSYKTAKKIVSYIRNKFKTPEEKVCLESRRGFLKTAGRAAIGLSAMVTKASIFGGLFWNVATHSGALREYDVALSKMNLREYPFVRKVNKEQLRRHTHNLTSLANEHYKPKSDLSRNEKEALLSGIAKEVIKEVYGVDIAVPTRIKHPYTKFVSSWVSPATAVNTPVLQEMNWLRDVPEWEHTSLAAHEPFHTITSLEENAETFMFEVLERAYQQTGDDHFRYAYAFRGLLLGLPVFCGLKEYTIENLNPAPAQEYQTYIDEQFEMFAGRLVLWFSGFNEQDMRNIDYFNLKGVKELHIDNIAETHLAGSIRATYNIITKKLEKAK